MEVHQCDHQLPIDYHQCYHQLLYTDHSPISQSGGITARGMAASSCRSTAAAPPTVATAFAIPCHCLW